jgi:hypothetical protein
MRTRRRFGVAVLGLAALALLLGGAGPAVADTIIIGGTNSNNFFPFGTNAYVGEYQQIYASSRFSGPVTISEIDFATRPGSAGNMRNLNFTLGLSSTAASVAAPGTNYAANKGPDFTTVFSGPFAFTAQGNGTFDVLIPVQPFTYDPAQGNLLLDVVINSASGSAAAFEFGGTPDAARIFNSGGGGAPAADPLMGLETQLTFTPFTPPAVPEPSSLALLGLGTAALAGWRLRRRRATA